MRKALSCGPLNTKLLEFIEGHLLGDMYMWPRKTGAQIGIGDKHKEYSQFVKQFLESYGLQCGKVYEGKRCWKTHSRTYQELLDLYNIWYPDDKKQVPKYFSLTPTSLKYWYIGDGNLKYEKRFKTNSPYINIATCAFSEESIQHLVNELQKFTIKASLVYKGKWPYIYISAHSGRKFLEMTSKSPVSCYDYKWRNKT